MNHDKISRGYTLVELLVAMTIVIFVSLLGANFIIQGLNSTTLESVESLAVRSARRAMTIMVKEIRGTNSSARGDYALSVINPTDFVFYNDVDSDGSPERVEYYLQNGDLIRSIIPAGADNSYSSNKATSTLAFDVSPDSIFTYLDSSNNSTTVINKVRMINIKIKIIFAANHSTSYYNLDSNAELRNLKDN